MHSNPETARSPGTAPLWLLVLSLAASLLALFQWMELLIVRSGGTSVCSISETVSCERVWDSAFATRVQHVTFLPVAGWGLVWSLTAFGLSLAFTVYRLSGKSEAGPAAGLRWTAAAGVFASLTFAAASARAGALCLTCLTTYALAFGFAAAVFLLIPGPLLPQGRAARDGLLWAGGFTLAGFLLALYPGLRTPHAQPEAQRWLKSAPALSELVSKLSPAERQLLSDAAHSYRDGPAPPASGVNHPVRMRAGPDGAPVRVVEFTDILCPHCRHFSEAVGQLRQAVPPEAFSVEPRQYPLDHECNPYVGRTDGSGVHCLAAQLLICLEGAPSYWKVSEALFQSQESLTPQKVRAIALSQGADVAALEQCAASPQTAAKLADDERYAQEFHIPGTPLVLVNGREAFPSTLFLYALVLAGGNPEALASLPLPPPRSPP